MKDRYLLLAKIVVLPCWIIVCMCKPFMPKRNSFKTLAYTDFAMYSTPLNKAFGIYFWGSAILAVLMLIYFNQLPC